MPAPDDLFLLLSREPLLNPSCRRRPVSNALNPLDSGLRRNDERRINQSSPRHQAFRLLIIVLDLFKFSIDRIITGCICRLGTSRLGSTGCRSFCTTFISIEFLGQLA